jgi:hypothetical protein
MTQPLISLKDARTLLTKGNRIRDLVKLIGETHEIWMESYGEHHAVLDSTARGRIFHCHFYSLAGVAGLALNDYQQQKYISFDERAALRLKAFGRQLQTSNYPTRQNRRWVRQERLDDFEPFARLELGYRFDLMGLNIRDIFVTHPNGINRVFHDWIWQVYGERIDSIFGIQKRFNAQGSVNIDDIYWYDNFAMRT